MQKKEIKIKGSVIAGLKGLCPECHKGKIFSSYLKVASCCRVCGLDFSFADPADGPAYIVMSIVMTLSTILVVWLEVKFDVPFWVHIVVTFPFTIVAILILLPYAKGWLVGKEYSHERAGDKGSR